jgi:recombination protein U
MMKTTYSTRGAISLLQGQKFEDQIEIACELYRRAGIADIQKTPEPVKPLQAMGNGRFLAVYTSKAQADFKGTLKGGRSVLFEAKTTATGKMEQARVTARQTEQMERGFQLGAEVFVMCMFIGSGAYRIPWAFWRDMKNQVGRKYVTPTDVSMYQVQVGKNGALDFLAVH